MGVGGCPKDSKNVIRFYVGQKTRSRQVPKDIAQFFTDYGLPNGVSRRETPFELFWEPRKVSDSLKVAKVEVWEYCYIN